MLNNIDFDFNKESKKKKEKNKKNQTLNNDNRRPLSIFSQIYTALKIWFNSITFMVKLIVIISIILWIIDLFTNNYITYIFANIPYYSIGSIFWVSDGKVVEKMKGSLKYLIYFLIHSIIIQIFYSIIYYFLINKNIPNKDNIRSIGLWCYIICEVTMNCLISPESKIYLPFIPYPIKSKFFPIIILLIFFIFGGFDLGMFIAFYLNILKLIMII